jgi:hypothetical protein
MSPRTPEEVDKINALFRYFIDGIDRADVDRQTACDALEFTLLDLLIEVCESEAHVMQYYDTMRERAVGMWRRTERKKKK